LADFAHPAQLIFMYEIIDLPDEACAGRPVQAL